MNYTLGEGCICMLVLCRAPTAARRQHGCRTAARPSFAAKDCQAQGRGSQNAWVQTASGKSSGVERDALHPVFEGPPEKHAVFLHFFGSDKRGPATMKTDPVCMSFPDYLSR